MSGQKLATAGGGAVGVQVGAEAAPAASRRSTTEVSGTDIGLLVLRGTFGLLMAGHGLQKFFGWWGAPDFDGVSAGFAQIGYSPGRFFAVLASGTELVAGLLFASGLLTPLACAGIIGVMVNVIVGVSWDSGLYSQNGYELPLMFGLVALSVAFTGPGRFALDRGRWAAGGVAPGLTSLGLGVVSALVVLVGFKG
ncbi:MAG: DoxX family protein [Acidimicrobiia bacterium]